MTFGWNKIMQLSKKQITIMGQATFIKKLEHAFCRDITEFAELGSDERAEFLVTCLFMAESRGLITEQGIASYSLVAWWLGIGFEEKSKYLISLFKSKFPEVRKVYAMNEWGHIMIGNPNNLTAADEKLKQSFYRTKAWG